MNAVRLCRCDECKFSDSSQVDRVTGKPFCTNWKQYLDCGCFYGSFKTVTQKETIPRPSPLGGLMWTWLGGYRPYMQGKEED